MTHHWQRMAAYNRWANTRLYAAAAPLGEEALCRDIGLYFRSVFATLVHVVQTDRAWLHIIRGGTLANLVMPAAPLLFSELRTARLDQDAALIAWLDTITDAVLAQPFAFKSGMESWRGRTFEGTLSGIVAHVFNHQTHHRGQAHAGLRLLGITEPPALDILVKGMLDA